LITFGSVACALAFGVTPTSAPTQMAIRKISGNRMRFLTGIGQWENRIAPK
jgi:hypothetical protein